LINNFKKADQYTTDFFKINATCTRLITCFRLPQWILNSLIMASIKWPKHVGVIEQ